MMKVCENLIPLLDALQAILMTFFEQKLQEFVADFGVFYEFGMACRITVFVSDPAERCGRLPVYRCFTSD